MNEATLAKLEFGAIREVLAGCCATSLGKGSALSLTPTTKVRLVRKWLDQVSDLNAVSEEFGLPPLGGVHDIREQVRAAVFPTVLEADALANVAETLAATGPLCAWLDRIADGAPTLNALRDRVANLSTIAEAISEAVDPRGEVRDGASERLASIRRSIEAARRQIRTVFDRILRHSSTTRMLQYAGATFHNDRMVLPLKAEQRGRIPGIIHRTSDSGATLFVEPAESVELNNTIVRMRDTESKEITRILRSLSQRIAANAKTILDTLHAISVLDLIAAKCRYAKKRSCVCPEINAAGVLDLHEARHPVLIELFAREAEEGAPLREVVPIDIRLGDDFDILVITGPNTGGKTVTLKTIGLLALMTQCGIPIPVGEGSKMPVYHDVFMDVGDEQSLQQSLSTFSSHLTTLLNILNNCGPRSLVLIDELGAGTDPDEGAAIGRAILTELQRLGSKTVITTHLSVLKAVAFTTARVDNGAVEFDPQSLKPTFRLKLGEPGNSNALIIAKRLGMPARIVKLAKGYLADETRALNEAIRGTLKSRREAEEARETARRATLDAQHSQADHQRQAQALKQSQEAFVRWTEWINALSPGDRVYVKILKREVKLVRMQLQKQTALVSAGAMDIEVPLRDIEMPAEQADT
ncbi:MAG: DNA strand exchange inhibitor protein [Planctomycetes bacterium]|nr:DNA strand exchange inhibitor protein [Planctomycetota bacterium]